MTAPRPNDGRASPNPARESPKASTKSARAEPQFDGRGFIDGSKAAYEMIVILRSSRRRPQASKDLLSREVYEGLRTGHHGAEQRGEKVETTSYRSTGRNHRRGGPRQAAQLTVRFLSKLITATRRDAAGACGGWQSRHGGLLTSPMWTFERALEAAIRIGNWSRPKRDNDPCRAGSRTSRRRQTHRRRGRPPLPEHRPRGLAMPSS